MDSLFVRTEEKSSGGILNLDFFTKSESVSGFGEITNAAKPSEISSTGKKRGRPKKKKEDENDSNENTGSSGLMMHQSNESYLDSYNGTNALIDSVIYEADNLNSMIITELRNVQASKTLKKKYDYIPQLAGTSSNLLSTKLGAIKEKNKTITDSHNLELKRIKDLKLNTKEEVNDDKYIMDMYNAFINTPVGNFNGGINMLDITTMNNNVGRIGMPNTTNTYDDYLNNMSATQNMMRLEQDPNIKVVVVYDASTGNRWFDVMNVQTGESIPNVDKPDQMFLEDTMLDTQNGIARNTNLDTTYPLIVINADVMSQY